jgi:hypothetical protein
VIDHLCRIFSRMGCIVAASAILSLGCSSTSKSSKILDPTSFVLTGMPAAEVIDTMSRHGFKCTIVENGKFTAHSRGETDPLKETVFEGVTFVKCASTRTGGLVSTVRTVFIVLDSNNSVTNVYEREDHTGL